MKGLLRFFAFLLVFILGFISCIGTMIGAGFYAYKNLSYDQLAAWGVPLPDASAYIQSGAEVNLRTMTPEQAVAEVMTLINEEKDITVDELITRYGIILPQEINDKIPPAARSVSLDQLMSGDGINYILQNTKVEYIYQFLPEGTLSDAAKEALADKTFKMVIDMDLTGLLTGVKLGYLVGVSYNKVGDEYVIVYANPDAPTPLELFANLDLAHVLDIVEGSSNLLTVLRNDLGDLMLEEVAAIVSDVKGTLVGKILADKTLASVLKDDGKGGYTLDVGSLVNGTYVGELLGYTPKYLDDDEVRGIIVGWMDGTVAVSGVNEGLAMICIQGVGEDGFEFTSLLDDFYLGYALGQKPVYDPTDGHLAGWTNPEGGEVTALYRSLVGKKISELLNGGITVESLLGDLKVGDLLGYTYDEATSKWMDGTEEVDALLKNLVDKKIVDLMDDGLDMNSILGDIKLGELLGYTYDEATSKWMDGTEEVDALLKDLVDKKVVDLMNDGIDMKSILGETKVGDLLGYTYDEATSKWMDGAKEVSSLLENLVNKKVSDLMDDGISIDVLFGTKKVGELLGYTYDEVGAKWMDGTQEVCGILAAFSDITIKDFTSHNFNVMDLVGDTPIGEILGYTYNALEGKWYDGSNAIVGVLATFVPLTLNELSNSATVTTKINAITISDLLGYEKVGDDWYDGASKVTGILAILAEKKVQDLNSIDDFSLADVLGYKKVGDEWQDGDGNPVTGILATLASKKVGELDTLNSLTVAEIMGYKQVGDEWQDGAGTPLTGIMAVLAPNSIDSLDGAISSTKIGELLGWKNNAGTWMDGTVAASGMMLAFADITLDGFSDQATVTAAVQTITVADALGLYEYGGKYYTDEGHTSQVTGVLGAVAGSQIGNMQSATDNLEVGQIFEDSAFDSGVLSLLDKTTKINDLPTKMESVFTTSTVAQLRTAGVMNISDADISKINTALAIKKGAALEDAEKCENMTVDAFVAAIVDMIP